MNLKSNQNKIKQPNDNKNLTYENLMNMYENLNFHPFLTVNSSLVTTKYEVTVTKWITTRRWDKDVVSVTTGKLLHKKLGSFHIQDKLDLIRIFWRKPQDADLATFNSCHSSSNSAELELEF